MELSPTAPAIPRPLLRRVENLTEMPHFACDKMGPGRRFYDTVVLKGLYALAPGALEPVAERASIVFADEPWDDAPPERASLRRVGELHLGSPGADVYVTGVARAYGGRPRPSWDVSVGVYDRGATLAALTLRAHGPRAWRHRAVRGWGLEEAAPTDAVPLRYELAFGGAHVDRRASEEVGAPVWTVHRPNPSGLGFVDVPALDRDRDRELAAPQWELPEHPIGAPGAIAPVAGLGPIARPWTARMQHAGTYDDAWRAEARRAHARNEPIDYPADFDRRFFHAAPPALRLSAPLRGDESIGLAGLLPDHERLVTRLPGVRPIARLFPGRRPWIEEPMRLDTVHVDLDAMRVSLLWRLTLDRERGVRGAILCDEGTR